MEKNKNIYFEAIINAIITVVISVLTTYLIGMISLEKIEVIINTAKSKDNYVTIVEIENYQQNSIVENCNIILEENVNIINITSNLENNITDNKITIEKIYPKCTETILIESEKELNSENVIFQIPVKNSIKWVAEEKFSINELISNIFTVAGTYIIITLISNIIMYSLAKKEIDIKSQEIARVEKEEESIMKTLDGINNEFKMYKRYSKYLMSKLNDFAKELEFWKNTIRKAFYNKETIKDSNELFTFVTRELKTFKTLKMCDSAELQFIFREYLDNEEK